nr:MAG TPA: hypothetical protein [Caudoviricetes sp.]
MNIRVNNITNQVVNLVVNEVFINNNIMIIKSVGFALCMILI